MLLVRVLFSSIIQGTKSLSLIVIPSVKTVQVLLKLTLDVCFVDRHIFAVLKFFTQLDSIVDKFRVWSTRWRLRLETWVPKDAA